MRTKCYFVQHFGMCASDLLLTRLHSHILLASVIQSQSRSPPVLQKEGVDCKMIEKLILKKENNVFMVCF